MVGGDGLLTLAGYDSFAADIPWGVVVAVGVPMVLLAASAPALSVWFALRARREHVPGAVVPLALALVLGGGMIGLNLAAALFG